MSCGYIEYGDWYHICWHMNAMARAIPAALARYRSRVTRDAALALIDWFDFHTRDIGSAMDDGLSADPWIRGSGRVPLRRLLRRRSVLERDWEIIAEAYARYAALRNILERLAAKGTRRVESGPIHEALNALAEISAQVLIICSDGAMDDKTWTDYWESHAR